MKKLFLYLLVVLATCFTSQAASYKTAVASSVTPTVVNTTSEATPATGFHLRKQSVFAKTFSKLKKHFAPGDVKTGYRSQGGWAIASFICGVVGLFVASVPLGIAAAALGIVAISKHSQYQGLAIAGLTLGILEALIVLIYVAAH